MCLLWPGDSRAKSGMPYLNRDCHLRWQKPVVTLFLERCWVSRFLLERMGRYTQWERARERTCNTSVKGWRSMNFQFREKEQPGWAQALTLFFFFFFNSKAASACKWSPSWGFWQAAQADNATDVGCSLMPPHPTQLAYRSLTTQ